MRLSREEFELLKRCKETLRPLAALITRASRRQYFVENLDADEPEIALETLCEFLLETDAPAVAEDAIVQIETAHQLMKTKDDCVRNLRAKRAAHL